MITGNITIKKVFVTQKDNVSVSFFNKQSLQSCLQIPIDALLDLK